MKIISANRSDTFDEYLRIISRYNEKNLVKEGTWLGTGKNTFKGAEKVTSRGAGELAAELASAATKTIDPARFAKAGVSGIDDIKKIFSVAEDLLTGDKFLIEEAGKLRRATPDELLEINKYKAKYPTNVVAGNNVSFNAGIGTANPAFKKIHNVTIKNSVDLAKELQTGSKFAGGQALEFRKITADLIGDPTPVRSVTAPGPASQVGTTGGTGSPVINNINNTTVNLSDAVAAAGGRAGGSILDTSKLATKGQITAMRTFFKKSFDGLSTTLADHITKIDDLLKTRNADLLTEVGIKVNDAIKVSLVGVTTKVDEISATVTKIDGDIAAINTTVKNLEGQVASGNTAIKEVLDSQKKAAEEMVAMRKQMADSLEEMKKMKNQLEESIKASRVAVSEATPAVTKVTWWAKTKNFLVSAATIAAAVAGSYWLYNKLTGEDEESEGGGNDSGNTAGNTGVPEEESDGFKNQMDDPVRREALMDNVEKLNGEETPEGTALLNRMVAHYGAAGFVKLDEPISINGMAIRYVFPVKVSGGNNPVQDLALRDASKSYMNKIYVKKADKYIYTTTRFASSAGSSDPQKIANYAFSIIAGDKQFSSKGTLFGERGKRYGKGKRNVAIRDFGMAGTSQKNMTREEKRAIKNMNRMSDADDFMENNIDDPMQSFSSGQNEFFQKKAEDIKNSTNKYSSYEFAKKADKVSNRYFKDAVQDLQDDEFMKAYYSGFSKLHNEKPKKKKEDYEKLYDLHDETGADLVHEAHPKAITVAEAIGKGGLVENGSERSKAMEDIAFRVPSGNYRARYAFIQEALRKKS